MVTKSKVSDSTIWCDGHGILVSDSTIWCDGHGMHVGDPTIGVVASAVTESV